MFFSKLSKTFKTSKHTWLETTCNTRYSKLHKSQTTQIWKYQRTRNWIKYTSRNWKAIWLETMFLLSTRNSSFCAKLSSWGKTDTFEPRYKCTFECNVTWKCVRVSQNGFVEHNQFKKFQHQIQSISTIIF